MNDEIWTRKEVDSPCVQLCTIHPEERICVGCFRSIDEIMSWGKLTPEARRTIMAELLDRAPRLKKRRGGRARKIS